MNAESRRVDAVTSESIVRRSVNANYVELRLGLTKQLWSALVLQPAISLKILRLFVIVGIRIVSFRADRYCRN
jgi:hypothetical protein